MIQDKDRQILDPCHSKRRFYLMFNFLMTMLVLVTFGGSPLHAKIDDFNQDIRANLKEAKMLRREVREAGAVDGVEQSQPRARIVVEDKVATSYVAPTGDKFKFGREKRKHYNPRDDRNSKRLATEMGQVYGQ